MEQIIERYRRLPLQFKLLILFLATGGAAGYGWMTNVDPALENVKVAEGENEALEMEIANLNKAGRNIVAVEAELRKADEDIAALLDLLPGEPEVDRVLGYFAIASKETGVEVKDFVPINVEGAPTPAPVSTPPPVTEPGKPDDPSKMNALNAPPPVDDSVMNTVINVKLQGSFAQMALFFDRVLGLPRVIRLTSFELKNESKAATGTPQSGDVIESNAGAPKLTVSATFEAYSQKGLIDQFRREEQEAPKPTPPQAAAGGASGTPAGTPSDAAAPAPGTPGAPSTPGASGDTSLSAKPLEGGATQ